MSSTLLPAERPKRRIKRQPTYSEAQRAHALAVLKSNGENYFRTSKETGISRKTLKDWQTATSCTPKKLAADQLRDLAEAQMVDVYDHAARKAALLSIENMDKANAYQQALMSGIFTDKRLLLSGQPTQIHGHTQGGVSLSPDQVRAFQAFLREARATATPVTGTDTTVTAPALCAHTEPATVSTLADATAPVPPTPVGAPAPIRED